MIFDGFATGLFNIISFNDTVGAAEARRDISDVITAKLVTRASPNGTGQVSGGRASSAPVTSRMVVLSYTTPKRSSLNRQIFMSYIPLNHNQSF